MPTDARMKKIDDLLIKMGHLTTKVKQFINVVLWSINALEIGVFLFGTDSRSCLKESLSGFYNGSVCSALEQKGAVTLKCMCE